MDVPYMSLDYVSPTHCMVQLCGSCLYLVLIVSHADPSDVVLLFKKCIVYLILVCEGGFIKLFRTLDE